LQGMDVSKDIREIDRYIAQFIEPKEFIGESSYELKYDRDFETNCIVLSEYANKPVKNLTVKEYFTLLQYHNKKVKESERRRK